ncbi:hypothetical protein L596_014512 [Steinernema carpocapsae]|uniref:UPF3 domain-containing protein n=1 Tax=Steinernema carpocapsae TaxID=34508 RepID=A0A4U5NCD1_STECR|nr:hypothetical protein L596_014512 [Steinernema carpocapsae]
MSSNERGDPKKMSKKAFIPQKNSIKDQSSNQHVKLTKELQEKDKPIKMVLRRLPMEMTWDDLKIQLEPIPEYTYHRFCTADKRLRPNAFTRVYFGFLSQTDAVKFQDRFNGYVFVDKDGFESTGVVEVAPNRDIPETSRAEAKRYDFKVGSMSRDSDFLKFKEEYDKPYVKKKVDFEALLKAVDEKEKNVKDGAIQQTPLTEFIVQKTIDRIKRLAEKKKSREEKFGTYRGARGGRFGRVEGKNVVEPPAAPSVPKEKPPGPSKPVKEVKPSKFEKFDKFDKPRAEPNPNGNRRERRAAAAVERRHAKAALRKETGKKAQEGAGDVAAKPKSAFHVKAEPEEKPSRKILVTVQSSKRRNAANPKPAAELAEGSLGSAPRPSGSRQNTGGSSGAPDGSKRDRPAPNKSIKNKDRPERAIYQPGQRRRGGGAGPNPAP